ncbi:hypothetical protein L207DRAFT_638717 [Hyaloscypha variabilis F]|uniref:Uncharacterized protein n=1 Tax=Hyaloscypha variabilis (strain UAMH 11265 / GT02V1 / F) TaxID=1149755 RepID=A0A2J6R6M3_HYAVF|nr:hypothetical protein L207DRAFT_638717 [Hyaloscypha variabilis F]
MDVIGIPEVQELMRIPPIVPVERIDSTVRTSSNNTTYCRLDYTPKLRPPVVPHPGSYPTPLTPPRPLPPRKRGDTPKSRQLLKKHYNTKVVKYNIALKKYDEETAEWHGNHEKYLDALDVNELVCKNEDSDSNDGEEESQDDPIAAAQPLVVFTHGRNSTLDNTHITAFCQVFRTLVNNYPSIKVFAGRSAGARNAAKASIHAPVKRLIFFTYALVRDLEYRYADLLALGPDIEVLFIVGDGDPLAVETHLREVRNRMRAKSWWIKLIKGNHSFNSWSAEEVENTLDIAGQIAAIWAKTETLDPDLSEMKLQASFDTGKAEWTGWQVPEPETPVPETSFKVQVEGGTIPNGGGSFQFSLPGVPAKRKGNRGRGAPKK